MSLVAAVEALAVQLAAAEEEGPLFVADSGSTVRRTSPG
jgi:hypothetical protein